MLLYRDIFRQKVSKNQLKIGFFKKSMIYYANKYREGLCKYLQPRFEDTIFTSAEMSASF